MADTHAAISKVIRISGIAADGRTLTMCNSQGRVGVTRYKTPHERHRSFLQKPRARSFTIIQKYKVGSSRNAFCEVAICCMLYCCNPSINPKSISPVSIIDTPILAQDPHDPLKVPRS